LPAKQTSYGQRSCPIIVLQVLLSQVPQRWTFASGGGGCMPRRQQKQGQVPEKTGKIPHSTRYLHQGTSLLDPPGPLFGRLGKSYSLRRQRFERQQTILPRLVCIYPQKPRLVRLDLDSVAGAFRPAGARIRTALRQQLYQKLLRTKTLRHILPPFPTMTIAIVS